MDDKPLPRKVHDALGNQNPNLQGIGGINLGDALSFHRHSGGPADGSPLFGPYYIFDANGKKRKLSVDGSGVATWSLI